MSWEDKFKDNLLQVLYREDQCRVPAGSPAGGQFASCGLGGSGGSGGTLGEMGLPSKQDWQGIETQSERYVELLRKDLGKYHSVSAIDRKIHVEQRLQERLAGNEDYEYFVQELQKKGKKGWLDPKSDHSPESQLIDGWAKTSGKSPLAIYMQQMAAEEFQLTEVSMDHLDPRSKAQVDEKIGYVGSVDKFNSGARAFLREMYNETQAELASAGITELTVMRGMAVPTGSSFSADIWKQGGGPGEIRSRDLRLLPGDARGNLVNSIRTGTTSISLQPMSSFSTNIGIATRFANGADKAGQDGALLVMKVPASRVLSTPYTGYGCLGESEVVVLGGTGQSLVNVSKGWFNSDIQRDTLNSYLEEK